MSDNIAGEMKATPKVTVITVCLNSENEIEETLNSILKQTYCNIEYIVKDGASSDQTMNVLNKYKKAFERKEIEYKIISKRDKSIYEAMNEGIRRSTGEWIGFMNVGDTYYDERVLERTFEGKDYHDADILYGDNMVEDEFGKALNMANMDFMEKKMPFNHQAAFFRSNSIKRYMYNETFYLGADYDLILSMYQDGRIFQYLGLIVSKYKLNGITSTKYVETARERQRVRNAHGYYDNTVIEKTKIFEAYMKEIIERYCPKYLLKYLNLFYKKRVKKYKLYDPKDIR